MATQDHIVYQRAAKADGSVPDQIVARTTLTAGINASVTTVPVAAVTNLSAGDTIVIGDERMTISSISSNNLTVSRGAEGTAAAVHSNGAVVSEAVPEWTTMTADQRAFIDTGSQPMIEIVNRTSSAVNVWTQLLFQDDPGGQVIQQINIDD